MHPWEDTWIEVHGEYFSQSDRLSCVIDNERVYAEFSNSSFIRCKATFLRRKMSIGETVTRVIKCFHYFNLEKQLYFFRKLKFTSEIRIGQRTM